MKFKTIIEPFKIKVVEPLIFLSKAERKQRLVEANYNLFKLKSDDVLIDFLTDSGTSAMSASQWGELIKGDESYAGSRSFYEFKNVVEDLTGLNFIFPTHQGRAAERILFSIISGPGKYIPNNTHFDTTRANIEFSGGNALDLISDNYQKNENDEPFKGNMDTGKLLALIEEKGRENIPVCFLTITNNSCGGQPVSMQNIREVSGICREYKIPFFLDAARFAENAYLIKRRECGYENKEVIDISKEMFSYADGCTMSAKKDAFANMGGFLACNDENLAAKINDVEILTEGFPTYGGLSGRDLAAMAQGLREIVEENYLNYRYASANYLSDALVESDIPIIRPAGIHAIYIDAKKFLPHIPSEQFPAQALCVSLYEEGGIRAVEIGSLMFGEHSSMELVRLALPRRVYTQSHIDYVIEVLNYIKTIRQTIRGVKIKREPPFLRHFSADLDLI